MAASLLKPHPPPRNPVAGAGRTKVHAANAFDLLLKEIELGSNVSPRARSNSRAPLTARVPSATAGVLGDVTHKYDNAAAAGKPPRDNSTTRVPLTARDPRTAAMLAKLQPDSMPHHGSILDTPPTSTVSTPRVQSTPDQPSSSGPGMSCQEGVQRYAPNMTAFELREIQSYGTVYYCGQRCNRKVHGADVSGPNNHGYDDAQGDYKIIQDDHIAYRYQILQPLGRGSFGQVSKAMDHKTQTQVALKIIKNKKKFHEQALVEVKVLKHLNNKDGDNSFRVVRMLGNFIFRDHMVIVFQLQGMSLYDLHKANRFAPMTEASIRTFARQLLQTLVLTHREHVVHCDMKPENVLLELGSKSAINVIDFGSACFDSERLYTYIQSRFYRAPEVLLGIPYTCAIDVWSVGCMLAEFSNGYPLFPGESEVQQMLLIMETFGAPPKTMLDRAPRKRVFFDSTGAPKMVPNSRGKTPRPGTKSLANFVQCTNPDFLDLLLGLLAYDPERRLTPSEALRHPFFGAAPAAPKPPTGEMNLMLPRLQPSKRR